MFKIPSLKSEPAVEEKKMDFKPLTMNIKLGPALQSVNTALDSRKEEPLVELKTEEKKKEEASEVAPSHQSSFVSENLSSQGDEKEDQPKVVEPPKPVTTFEFKIQMPPPKAEEVKEPPKPFVVPPVIKVEEKAPEKPVEAPKVEPQKANPFMTGANA